MSFSVRDLLVAAFAGALVFVATSTTARGDDVPAVKCATWHVDQLADQMSRDGVNTYHFNEVNDWTARQVEKAVEPLAAAGYRNTVWVSAAVPDVGVHKEWAGIVCLAR